MKKAFPPTLFLVLWLNSLAVFSQSSGSLDRSKIPGPGPAPVIQIGTYDSLRLGNGMRVFVVTNRKLPRVAFNLVLDYDPILEKEYAGYVDIAGQMLRSGTATRTKAQLDEEIDFIGASLSTSATGVYGVSLKKHQDKLLQLMADVVLNPAFPQSELDRIKKETKSGLAAQKDEPEAVASLVNNIVLYGPNHPYGEPTTEQTVEKVTLDQVKSFYATYYKPNIAYLAIVGDITLAEARTAVEKYFGAWQRGSVPKSKYTLAAQPAKTRVALVDRASSVQSVVSVSHSINLRPGAPDVIKTRIANDILGGQGGRLFNNLREKRGLTYGAYSSLASDRLVGEFSASASVRNAVTDSAVVEFLSELRRIRTEPVSAEELKKSKASVTGSFVRSLESPQTVASFAINTARYQLPADYYKNYLRQVSAVTAADVQAVAKKYVRPANATITVVGNGSEIADQLKPFGPIDYYDAEGNQIKPEAKKATPAGLTADQVIDAYVKAIGGKENLAKVQDVTRNMTASIQGMELTAVQQQKVPNKYRMAISMQGSEAFNMTSNGTKAAMSQMGNRQELQDKTLEAAKVQSTLFAELYYDQLGVKRSLAGVEKLGGGDAYKLELTMPGGDKVIDYFDSATGLKVRQVTSTDSPQGAVTQTTDYGDYREVNGVKFPHKISSSMGMQLEVQSIEINKGLKDEVFEVK
ncbi:MAG: insulinase family protein [Ferruginibacter sp.]|nr:insulinase family protein [Cytophagales bacterium]